MIADTPEAVELFRLLTLKSALKLQSKGLNLSRGINARKLTKQATGLTTNDFPTLIEALEKLIQEKGQNPDARFKSL